MSNEQGVSGLNQLEKFFDDINKKLPPLPENAKKVIVNITPWIILITSIILIPAVLAVFGLGAILGSVFVYSGVTAGTVYYITWALTLVTFIMEIVAIKGLFDRKMSAWRLVFYAALINAVSNLISLSIASFIISTAISLYLLFQIRSYYKD